MTIIYNGRSGLNSDEHNVTCCVLCYKLFMPIYMYLIVYSAIYIHVYMFPSFFFCVSRTFIIIWIKTSVSYSELIVQISRMRVTSEISTSYTLSNSRNSFHLQTNLLLTNGCEKPKQSSKKRGHLFKSQSKTFLNFVHTLKVFMFWHRGHVSVFLDSFEEDADLTIV